MIFYNTRTYQLASASLQVDLKTNYNIWTMDFDSLLSMSEFKKNSHHIHLKSI